MLQEKGPLMDHSQQARSQSQSPLSKLSKFMTTRLALECTVLTFQSAQSPVQRPMYGSARFVCDKGRA